MSTPFWTRLGAGLAVGALVALSLAPAAAAAPELPAALLPPSAAVEQLGFLPYPNCAVSGGGFTGGLNNIGQSQILSFGSGGFHGPYYSPSFGSNGIGTIGGFLNFTGGLPSCSGFGSTTPQYSSAPFVLSSFGSGQYGAGLGLWPTQTNTWGGWGGAGGWGGGCCGWGGYPPYGANIGYAIR